MSPRAVEIKAFGCASETEVVGPLAISPTFA